LSANLSDVWFFILEFYQAVIVKSMCFSDVLVQREMEYEKWGRVARTVSEAWGRPEAAGSARS
jgi:hypothetical protein